MEETAVGKHPPPTLFNYVLERVLSQASESKSTQV